MNEYTLPARLFDTISLLPRLDTKIVDDMQAIPPADFCPHASASMGIFLQSINSKYPSYDIAVYKSIHQRQYSILCNIPA